MADKKLSVVIPAYNEAKNINSGNIEKVVRYLEAQNYSWEVVIVDDGSKDETVSLIKERIRGLEGCKLIENPHGGKAITVMTGLINSSGEIALFTDMDQATPISELNKILPKFNEGYEVVIGSRHGRKGAPIHRKIVAWGFSLLRNIILGLPYSDTQCGFKAFSRKSVESLFPPLLEKWRRNAARGGAVNAGFDIETLFLAKKKNLKIAEVGVEWQYVDTERVQVFRDAIEAIEDMIRIRVSDFQGKYG